MIAGVDDAQVPDSLVSASADPRGARGRFGKNGRPDPNVFAGARRRELAHVSDPRNYSTVISSSSSRNTSRSSDTSSSSTLSVSSSNDASSRSRRPRSSSRGSSALV